MTDPKALQQRILKLIEKHIEEMELEGNDEYTSQNLTRYLNSVTDYVDNDEKIKKADVKRLQDISEEEQEKIILDMADEIKKKNKGKK